MPAQPLTRRARWTGGACALAVLASGTSFTVAARSSARHQLTPIDIALPRIAFAGLVSLPIARWRRRVLALAEHAAWRAVS